MKSGEVGEDGKISPDPETRFDRVEFLSPPRRSVTLPNGTTLFRCVCVCNQPNGEILCQIEAPLYVGGVAGFTASRVRVYDQFVVIGK